MTDEPTAVSAEDRLIARHFQPLAKHPGALGLIDDAALLTPPPGQDIVLTADAIVGGVHFFPDDPPDMVAKKALRVNLSDLAAKGAAPRGLSAGARVARNGAARLDRSALRAGLAPTPTPMRVRCSAATPSARPDR